MHLVAFVGTDKENWGQITALINRMECEHIVLVVNSTVNDFPKSEKCSVVEVDNALPLLELKKTLINDLKPQIGKEFEVAVSLASGTGKEHIALIAALLNIPVGIRLAVYTKQGVQIIT